jgi:hypothetical protein
MLRSMSAGGATLASGVFVLLAYLLIPSGFESAHASPLAGVPTLPRSAFLAVTVLIVFAFVVISVIAVVDMLRRGAGEDERTIARRREATILVAGIVASFLFFYVSIALIAALIPVPEDDVRSSLLAVADDDPVEGDDAPAAEAAASEAHPTRAAASATVDERRERIVTIIAVGCSLVVTVMLVVRTVKRIRATPEAHIVESPEVIRREILRTARAMLERLASGVDHREAVIASYAIMEDTFAAQGSPRKPAQTPSEFIERVLASRSFGFDSTGTDAAIRRLAALYEVARFSDHPVEAPDRARAVALLRRIEAAFGGAGR